jgi:hypothetical protein
MFTVSENMRTPDTWFLLLISAIVAHLRLVGDSAGLAPNSITTRYCIGGKYEKRGLLISIHAF